MQDFFILHSHLKEQNVYLSVFFNRSAKGKDEVTVSEEVF